MKVKMPRLILMLALLILLFDSGLYFFISTDIPVHWNYAGKIDQYAPKWVLFGLGMLPLIFYYLIPFLQKIDPHAQKMKSGMKTYLLMRDLVVLLLIAMNLVTIVVIINQKIPAGVLIQVVIGLFMLGLGKYMPRLPRNYFVGFRTPWALSDEHTWYRTQRIGGMAFVASGFLLIAAGLFNQGWLNVICLLGMLGMVFGCCVYSWYIFASHHS